MELFSIVLKDDVAVDPRKYGDLLAPVLGVTKIEAKIAVKRGRGIFVQDISEEAARQLAASLEADGAANWVVANGDLPNLPAPRRVNHVERSHGALRYRWAGDLEPSEIPWTAISVVSVAAVALPEYKELYTGVNFNHMPAFHKMGEDTATRELLREKMILKMNESDLLAERAPVAKPRADARSIYEDLQKHHSRKVKVYADLVAADHSVWMRIAMDEMAYVHEAGGIKFGEAYGFNYLMQELATRLPRARTAVSAKFVSGADVNGLVFLTVEDFNRYTRWHFIRNHLCAPRDSSSASAAPPAPPTDAASSTS